MFGSELLVDATQRKHLVSNLRDAPPALSVAQPHRPSNRPGTLRAVEGAIMVPVAEEQAEPVDVDDEPFIFDDDVSSVSAALSATATPHRSHHHQVGEQSSTPTRGGMMQSPSPQSQRTREVVPVERQHAATNMDGTLVVSHEESPVVLAGMATGARPTSTAGTTCLFPVIPLSETLAGHSAVSSLRSGGGSMRPGNRSITSAPSEVISKNTFAVLTTPSRAPPLARQTSSHRRNITPMVAPPISPSSRASSCCDPDVEGGGSLPHPPPVAALGASTAQVYSGIGSGSMSAAVDKDMLLTENIVRRIVEEYTNQSRQSHRHAPAADSASSMASWEMFTSSVMSVSRTFEALTSVGKAKSTPLAGRCMSASTTSSSWLGKRAELAATHSTRIPQTYWITRDCIPSSTGSTGTPADGQLFQSLKDNTRVLTFPSTNPGNRPEVYLLARTLDQMIQDFVPGHGAVRDPSVAFAILPSELSLSIEAAASAAHRTYATAVRGVMEVLDVGLSEIARQIASVCPERAALLDCIRQCYSDFQHTLLDVVEHSKGRAFEEAIRRQEYDDVITTKNRQIIDSLAKISSLEDRVLSLEKELETNTMKATRFDELVSRMDLHEQQRQRAIVRVDQLEALDDAEEAVSRATMLAASVFEDLSSADGNKPEAAVESTMARLDRLRAEQEERSQVLLYDESVKLLKALRSAVDATDAACTPFYDRMLFSKPELNIAVASGRWAAIGKAIGEHEALWDHRERVAKAHALWLEVMTTKANARTRVPMITASNITTGDPTISDTPKDGPATKKLSIKEFECNVEQLRAMGIHDVTPEEIMMLQRDDFDSDRFLHPSQRIPPRWGLKDGGVAQMLSDAEMTFAEIASRLNALKNSELLADITKPAMMPPSRPSDPCVLCNRRDVVEMEKRQHRSFLDNVLKELSEREADGRSEVVAAQEERDKAKAQLEAQFDVCQKLEERLAMLESQTALQHMAPREMEAPPSSQGSLQPPPLLEISSAADAAMSVHGKGKSTNDAVLGGRSASAMSNARPVESPLDGAAEKKSPLRRRSTSRRSSSVLSLSSSSRSTNLPEADGHRSKSISPAEFQPEERRPSRSGSRSETQVETPASRKGSLRRKTSSTSAAAKASSTERKRSKQRSSQELPANSSGMMVPVESPGYEGPPLVLELVINCSCCAGGANRQPSVVPPVLSVVQDDTASPTAMSGGAHSPPKRPATGERRTSTSNITKPYSGGEPLADSERKVEGDDELCFIPFAATPDSPLPHTSSDLITTAGATKENKLGHQEGAFAAEERDDGDFALNAPQLASFIGAPDPVVTHTKSMRRGDSARPLVNRTTTCVPLRSEGSAGGAESTSIAGADEKSGGMLDPFGEVVEVKHTTDDDPTLETEGGFRQSSFAIARTGQETVAQAMWTQMEGQLLHRLKSTAVARAMDGDDKVLEDESGNHINGMVPKPPTTGRRSVASGAARKSATSASSKPLAKSSSVVHQQQLNAARRVDSTNAIRSLVGTSSTDEALEKGFKAANDSLRQCILKLSGRIESLQASSVRTPAWILRHIGHFYRSKRIADVAAEHSGHAYIPASQFLVTYLKRKLGANEVVYEHLHYLYSTCRALKESDLRVRHFMEVLFAFDNRQAAFFLQLSLALESSTIGLDYSQSHLHFTLDENPSKPEVVCLRRIAAVLTETGLHKRPYASFLWKALSHRSLAFEVDDDQFYASIRKAGMEAEAIRRHPPASWSLADVSLMRVVVLKVSFLSLICGLESKMHATTGQSNGELVVRP